ncbi:adenosylcobinamide-GDP ribazoletransferase [bacterium]|nr:adenosylcobinamide-GDP ribazoletransferase [bacterium]
MRSFWLALQFLTIFRIRKTIEFSPQDLLSSLRWFFIIGLFLGFLQWIICWLALKFHFPVDVSALFLVIVGTVITGGLHLDGVADFADGFGAGRDADSVLRIMKDDRTGVYGIAAIVLALFSRMQAFMHTLNWETFTVVLIAPILSRSVIAGTCTILPYARKDGTAKAFAGGSFFKYALIPIILSGIISIFIIGIRGFYLFGISIFLSILFCLYCYWRIKGFTGDTLGAQNELVEIVTLLAGGMLH